MGRLVYIYRCMQGTLSGVAVRLLNCPVDVRALVKSRGFLRALRRSYDQDVRVLR